MLFFYLFFFFWETTSQTFINCGYEIQPKVHLQYLVVYFPSRLVMKKKKLLASQASELQYYNASLDENKK